MGLMDKEEQGDQRIHIPSHIPGAAARSEALDLAIGLCKLQSMKKCRSFAK